MHNKEKLCQWTKYPLRIRWRWKVHIDKRQRERKKVISRISFRIGSLSFHPKRFSIMKFWNKQIKSDIIEVKFNFHLLSRYFFVLFCCCLHSIMCSSNILFADSKLVATIRCVFLLWNRWFLNDVAWFSNETHLFRSNLEMGAMQKVCVNIVSYAEETILVYTD